MTEHTFEENQRLVRTGTRAVKRMYKEWEQDGGPSPSAADAVHALLTAIAADEQDDAALDVAVNVFATLGEYGVRTDARVAAVYATLGMEQS